MIERIEIDKLNIATMAGGGAGPILIESVTVHGSVQVKEIGFTYTTHLTADEFADLQAVFVKIENRMRETLGLGKAAQAAATINTVREGLLDMRQTLDRQPRSGYQPEIER